MKSQSVTRLFGWSLGLLLVCAAQSTAATSPRIVKFSNRTLRHYRIQAACLIRSNYRGVLGRLYGRRFVAGISRPRRAGKGFTSSVRFLTRSCRKIALSQRDANTAQPSPQPVQGPVEQPSNGGGGSTVPVPPAPTPSSLYLPAIPSLAAWEDQMKRFGQQHCNLLNDNGATFDNRLAATYYDAEWIYYRVADYTRDPKWINCAQAAERIYRDQYAVPADGTVPGYWNFSHGLMLDFLRTGDENSRRAVALLAHNAAFAVDSTPLAWTADSTASREVAYTIMAYLNAETIGESRRARLTAFVDQALGHLDQWTVSQTAPYVRPFMVALTSQALISYYEKTGDRRIVPAIRIALDWIWDRTWVPGAQAFQYTDRVNSGGGTEVAPDLNLLIAPAYAWMYRQTGERRFLDRGDQIFQGGVAQAFLNNAKQYNQNYRWSFDFVRWRQ